MIKVKLTQTYDAIIYDGHNKNDIQKFIGNPIHTELPDKTSKDDIKIYFKDSWGHLQYISKGNAIIKVNYDEIKILKPEEFEPYIQNKEK